MTQNIPTDLLDPHPQNPRLILREDVIAGIEAQLKEQGEFDPAHALLVRPMNGRYQIIRGHHRVIAAKRAGILEVPCWVREMGDDDAYMQLALDNVQGELSSLEIGIHSLKAVKLGDKGRGKTGGIREYAKQLGYKDHTGIIRYRQGAEVWLFIEPFLENGDSNHHFLKRADHLAVIYKLPRGLWKLLGIEMLSHEWSAQETDNQAKKVKTLIDLVPDWWSLNLESLAHIAIDGQSKPIVNMLKFTLATDSELETVTLHRLKETDETQNRNGREFRLWKSEPQEFDAKQIFRNRILAIETIPTKQQVEEIKLEILRYINDYSAPSERYFPVLSDSEWTKEQARLRELEVIEQRKFYIPRLIHNDVLRGLRTLHNGSIDLICTDPPYNIGKAEWDELGDSKAYVKWCKGWIQECYRVLKDNGSLYVFGKFKMLCYLLPVAEAIGFALQKEIIWDTIQGSGGSGLWPDRHETILFFTKSDDYYSDEQAVKVNRHEENIREYKGVTYELKSLSNVWRYPCVDDKDSERTDHPTQKPVAIIERIIKASSPVGGIVLDCFIGSGTTGVAAMLNKRRSIGIDNKKEYIEIAKERFENTVVGDSSDLSE